jgi:hypothetical protein
MYLSGLIPNSKFLRDKMPALGKPKPIAVHSFVEFVKTRCSRQKHGAAVGREAALRSSAPAVARLADYAPSRIVK